MKKVFLVLVMMMFCNVANALETELNNIKLCNYILDNYDSLKLEPLNKDDLEVEYKYINDFNHDGQNEMFYQIHEGSGSYVSVYIKEDNKDKIYITPVDDDFGNSYVGFLPVKYNDRMYLIKKSYKHGWQSIFILDEKYQSQKICKLQPIYSMSIENSKNDELCNLGLNYNINYLPNNSDNYDKNKYIEPQDRYDEIRAYYQNIDLYNNGSNIDFIEYAQNPGYPSQCPQSFFNIDIKTEAAMYCKTGIRLAKYENEVYIVTESWIDRGVYFLYSIYKFNNDKLEKVCTYNNETTYTAK